MIVQTSAICAASGTSYYMPSPLDILFQAAAGLAAPTPGQDSVQVQVTVTQSPEAAKWQGILLYPRRKEVKSKKSFLIEPAFFSGSISMVPGPGNPLTLTITEPRIGAGARSNYSVSFSVQSAPLLHGNFVPNAVTMGESCVVYGMIPNLPTQSGLIIVVWPPTVIEF